MQSSHGLKLRRFSLSELESATTRFSGRRRLGLGRHGEVYAAEISLCDKLIDVPIIRFDKESEIMLQMEIDRFCSLQNDNIISLLGYCEKKDEKILVYKFMRKFSLYDYLFKYEDQIVILSVNQRLNILRTVAEDIYDFHWGTHTNITRGDVNTANILWQGIGFSRNRDFRLSRTKKKKKIKGDLQGTNGYLAPECYEPNYEICIKADVYAFGVVCLELLCERPASKNLIISVLPFILKGELPTFIPEHVKTTISPKCSKACANLIMGCLDNDPEKRPCMGSVIDSLGRTMVLLLQESAQMERIDEGPDWSCKRMSLEDIKRATNDFSVDNLLGEGDYWKSYRGNNISGETYNEVVSVKRINKEFDHDFFFFKKEVQLLEGFDHVNVLSLVGYCNEEYEKIIVYEYMSKGSLYDNLYNDQDGTPRLTVEQRLNICIGVAEGFSYLHANDIIHRNLSTNNILLDSYLVPGISGVEFSSNEYHESSTYALLVEEYIHATIISGTHHLAPECYKPNYPPGRKADVYAFGMLLLEVLSVKPLWKSLVILALEFANTGELPRFGDEYLKINIAPECSQACKNIIRDCLDIDPDKRPSITQVVDELELALRLQEIYQNSKANSQQSPQLSIPSLSSCCQSFPLSDIIRATNNFSNCLGEGAFGKVYSGTISSNIFCNGKVAVKCMMGAPEQQIPAFKKEIELVSGCNHVNVITLAGYCEEENEKILIYELMPNGSLYDYIYRKKDHTPRLSIEQRLKICIGVAKGLDYLHSRTDSVIIHSDLKTDNILLDKDMVPKISDFGLSRTRVAGPSTSKQITYHVKGTTGYLAPECYEPNYHLSRKADVYAYGVVLLEVLCEKPAWNNLVTFALPFIRRREIPNFTPDYVARHISKRCLRACQHLIMECLDTDPIKRPNMNQVVTKISEALRLEKKYSKDHLLPFTDPEVFSSSSDRAVLYHEGPLKLDEDQEVQEALEALRIIHRYGKCAEDRDVSLKPIFTDQLNNIFGWRKYSLPQLFIGGNHVGGLRMIRMLDKDGTIEGMSSGLHRSSCSCHYKSFISQDPRNRTDLSSYIFEEEPDYGDFENSSSNNLRML